VILPGGRRAEARHRRRTPVSLGAAGFIRTPPSGRSTSGEPRSGGLVGPAGSTRKRSQLCDPSSRLLATAAFLKGACATAARSQPAFRSAPLVARRAGVRPIVTGRDLPFRDVLAALTGAGLRGAPRGARSGISLGDEYGRPPLSPTCRSLPPDGGASARGRDQGSERPSPMGRSARAARASGRRPSMWCVYVFAVVLSGVIAIVPQRRGRRGAPDDRNSEPRLVNDISGGDGILRATRVTPRLCQGRRHLRSVSYLSRDT
jgi:hypothetical protein